MTGFGIFDCINDLLSKIYNIDDDENIFIIKKKKRQIEGKCC